MPVVGTMILDRLSRFKQEIVHRVGTRAARFRLAVSLGFVAAAVGFLVVAADTRSSIAQSIFGFMNLGGDPQPSYAPPPAPSAQYYSPRKRHYARKKSTPLHLARAGRGDDAPVSLARRSICVRLCDGFAFPVGDYHGDGDRAAHEATCQSECPGAETALFVVPQGSDSLGDAVRVGSSLNYSRMPEAFHYTSYVDGTCSCHPQSGNRIKSLLHDFTLRRGDTVMTPTGMQVFHGGSFPFKRKDFVALAKSRDIGKGDRETLKAIERASSVPPTTVAGGSDPLLTSDAKPNGTKALQHQAVN